MSTVDAIAPKLTQDQNEVLREIVNIGMGQAGASLAAILQSFVELSIPQIVLAQASELPAALVHVLGKNAEVTAVRQAFFGHWHGEALAVYNEAGCKDLADLMGYTSVLEKDTEVELLLDVANVVVGACLNGVAEQLGAAINFGPPSVFAHRVLASDLMDPKNLTWSHTLLMEVHFGLENRRFKTHIVTMMSEDTIDTLCKDLDGFLERL